jgi:quinol monooxygenase YgiN
MSGRRRRDDGWDDGHPGAQDDRRDPWADSSVDEWADRDRGHGDDAGRRGAPGAGKGAGGYPARGGAGSYATNNAAPRDYGRGAAAGGDRYGAGAGYGGQRNRGAANGYEDSGYGRAGNGESRRDAAGYGAAPGGQRNGSGYGGNGRPGGSAYAPEFMPADSADLDVDGPPGTPRPYGRLSIYTLHEDKAREFDRAAERAAEGVRAAEPDTLVYVIHVVPKAPMQRIIYEIYRDRAAFLTHERQPHIRQFDADCASSVLATNIIDLRLKYAKVAALGSSADSAMPPQANRMPRAQEAAAGGDRYQQAAPQQPPTQYQPAQQAATQYARPQSQQPGGASFTPAKDQYGDLGQPTVGREAFQSPAQYGTSGSAAGNGQYGAANVHSGAAGYANGGSYSSAKNYQSPNGYQAGNGYSGSSGYPNGGSYQNGNDYSAANGYSASSGYSNGGSYQNGNGYPGDSPAPGPQYTPRYRELTSGASPDGAGGSPDDSGRQSYRPQSAERAPRSQDQR